MNIKAKAREWCEEKAANALHKDGELYSARHLLAYIESLPDDPPVNAKLISKMFDEAEIPIRVKAMDSEIHISDVLKLLDTLQAKIIQALSSPVGVASLDEFSEGEIQKIFKKVRDPEFTNLIAYEADVLVEEIKRLRKLVK